MTKPEKLNINFMREQLAENHPEKCYLAMAQDLRGYYVVKLADRSCTICAH